MTTWGGWAVRAAIVLLFLEAQTLAQSAACARAPGVPQGLAVGVVPGRAGATSASPRLPAALQIGWQPVVDQERPENAPEVYVVEAGTLSGISDVASVETDEPVTGYTAPVPNGTFYIRVRSRNACGTSGASRELAVRVTGSVPRGRPNPFVLLPTTLVIGEHLADTTFLRVLGHVRNGWAAAPASFVEVTAVFDGPAGESSETARTYVTGRSRRLARSRIVTDTVLEPGGTGCFVLFADFSTSERITGVKHVEVVADRRDIESVEGQVELDGAPIMEADDFGDLRVSGWTINTGRVTTYATEVWIEPINPRGQVLDCDAAALRSSAVETVGGETSPMSLESGARGVFETSTETVFVPDLRLRHWINWNNTREVPAAATERYRTLNLRLASMLYADEQLSSPQERAALRDALRDEIRSIEDGLAR